MVCVTILPVLFIILGAIIKLTSSGPIIFAQKRVGILGGEFICYKFRSMYQNANNDFAVKNDRRVTSIGRFIRKTHLDEFPQFYNVLIGDMSLVGTRPPTKQEYEQYELHHKVRLSAKPGLTGMWQTSGRSDITDFEEIVKLDLQYIENWSLWLDIKLIFKTVGVVLDRRGSK